MSKTQKREKYWQDDNSILSQDLTREMKIKIQRARRKYSEETFILEQWAKQGFTSGGDVLDEQE